MRPPGKVAETSISYRNVKVPIDLVGQPGQLRDTQFSSEIHLVISRYLRTVYTGSILATMPRIARGIAHVSKMKRFTSEIRLHDDDNIYYIDYVNADPYMNPRYLYSNEMPDEVGRHFVWLLLCEGMHLVKRGHWFFGEKQVESQSNLDWLAQRQRERREGHG